MDTTKAPNLSPEQAQRIISAIADCDRYIIKEEKMNADLRPAAVQKRLDGYKEHRAKLQRALDTKNTAELFSK